MLSPVNPINQEGWHTNRVKSMILIAADTPEETRKIASQCDYEASEKNGIYRNTPNSPWLLPELSSCVELKLMKVAGPIYPDSIIQKWKDNNC